MNNLSKVCVLPFASFNAYQKGQARACPMSEFIKDVDLNIMSIDEAFNSEEYKQLRNDMLSGKENDICKICYNMEKWGSESYRQKANREMKSDHNIEVEEVIKNTLVTGHKNPNFIKLDLRPSNICNFKCRTCSSDFSTRWVEEEKVWIKENGFEYSESQFKTIEKSFEISQSSIQNLREIYIAGGESLYMEEMYKFLERLENKKNIRLSIHTNFSIIKFKKYDIFELLKDFSRVMFFISIDGIGEVGEYVRTGFDYNIFCKNMKKLLKIQKEYPNIMHNFHYTSSILNVFHFYKFLSEMKEKKFIETDSQIHFFPVRWPTYYNSINFNIKDDIVNYYKNNFDKIQSEFLKIQIRNYINYVENVDMTQNFDEKKNQDGVDLNALEWFSKRINFGNNFNNTSIPKELEYLKKYLENT